MTKRYLIRLDDACPTMDREKWDRMERLLDCYGLKPMAGVIPANADPMQQIDQADSGFWEKVRSWEAKGWAIALHGYDHCYISTGRGINPVWPRSEFAGVPLEIQKEKIARGISILTSKGIRPKYFFAPSHTFDENTLTALRECSDIRIVSDTVATLPYRHGDFIFIPQIGGMTRNIPLPGLRTFCLHPSTMTEENFRNCEQFIEANRDKFTDFSKIDLTEVKNKRLTDKILSAAYFLYRKLCGL